MTDGNGEFKCGVEKSWAVHSERSRDIQEKVTDIYVMTTQSAEAAKHLNQLPVIADLLRSLQGSLLTAATGSDAVPKAAMDAVVTHMNSNTRLVCRVLCSVIVVLIMVIGSLLIGDKFEFIRALIR